MPVVVFDACVLYPAPLRDLLLWLATNGLVAARWSDQILEEWVESLLRNRPDLSRERLMRTCSEMNRAVPDAMVAGYESAIATLELPDPDDRHVLAAAIAAGADTILTHNLKDFPAARLPAGIRAIAPDPFLVESFETDPDSFLETLSDHRRSLRNPPKDPDEYLATFETQGLTRLVDCTRPFVDRI